jgi:hypothetical protein
MTFRFLIEAAGILTALVILGAWGLCIIAARCYPDPLACLDGSRLRCALDDRDRSHLLDAADREAAANTAAYLYAEREAMEMDAHFAMAAVDHPRWT